MDDDDLCSVRKTICRLVEGNTDYAVLAFIVDMLVLSATTPTDPPLSAQGG